MTATTILSDNGVASGSSGYKLDGGNDGTLQLRTTTTGGTATTAVTIDNSQNTTLAGYLNAPNTFGFKNRIINGGMSVDQRNNGSAFAITNTHAYCVDRWNIATSSAPSGTLTAQRVATNSPGGQQYVERLSRSAGSFSGYLIFSQEIETVNCYDLAGKNVTVSFQARIGSAYAGTNLTAYVFTGTGVDQGVDSMLAQSWTGFANPGSLTVTPTTSFQTFSFTAPIGSSVTEIGVIFATGSYTGSGSANDYIDITGVQLEKGSTATSFDCRPYGAELQLCQRYYQAVTNIWANAISGCVGTMNANDVVTNIKFSQQMRATPTITTFSENGTAGRISVNRVSAGYAANQLGADSWGVTLLNGSGSAFTLVSNVTFGWTASAEL